MLKLSVLKSSIVHWIRITNPNLGARTKVTSITRAEFSSTHACLHISILIENLCWQFRVSQSLLCSVDSQNKSSFSLSLCIFPSNDVCSLVGKRLPSYFGVMGGLNTLYIFLWPEWFPRGCPLPPPPKEGRSPCADLLCWRGISAYWLQGLDPCSLSLWASKFEFLAQGPGPETYSPFPPATFGEVESWEALLKFNCPTPQVHEVWGHRGGAHTGCGQPRGQATVAASLGMPKPLYKTRVENKDCLALRRQIYLCSPNTVSLSLQLRSW